MKYLLILVFMMLNVVSYGQIPIKNSQSNKIDTVFIQHYDSLTNFKTFLAEDWSYQGDRTSTTSNKDLFIDGSLCFGRIIERRDGNLKGLKTQKAFYVSPYSIYVGQTVFFLPLIIDYDIFNIIDAKQMEGYKNYFIPLPHDFNKNTKIHTLKNINSYDEIQGQQFVIEDYIYYNSICYLIISDKNTSVKYLWNVGGSCSPIILMGYFEKLKQRYIGSKYVFSQETIRLYNRDKNDADLDKRRLKDYSGKSDYIAVRSGEVWECVDLQLITEEIRKGFPHKAIKLSIPCLILKNTKGNEIAVTQYNNNDFYYIEKEPSFWDKAKRESWAKQGEFHPEYDYDFIPYETYIASVNKQKALDAQKQKEIDARNKIYAEQKQQQFEQLKSKYGIEVANLVTSGKVKVGMNADLCRIAWGAPSKVNKTTNALGVREQWVYSGNRYLYFENGILTTIQN